MSEPYIGEIMWFAGNFAPLGWAACEGQSLSINDHLALFSLLGVTYGGNGTTTFNLPDLRSTSAVGCTNSSDLGTSTDAQGVQADPEASAVASTATIGLIGCIALQGTYPPRG